MIDQADQSSSIGIDMDDKADQSFKCIGNGMDSMCMWHGQYNSIIIVDILR